jgi:hypothetical protein
MSTGEEHEYRGRTWVPGKKMAKSTRWILEQLRDNGARRQVVCRIRSERIVGEVHRQASMRTRGPGTCTSICPRIGSDTVSIIWRMHSHFAKNSDKPMRRKGELSPAAVDREYAKPTLRPRARMEPYHRGR